MNAHTNLPANLPPLRDIVADYDKKLAAFDDLCSEYKGLHTKVDLAATVGGTYAGRSYSYHASLSKRTLEKNLLESAWKYVWSGLNLDVIATATDRKQFELAMQNPPEFTMDNIGATFGDYIKDPRSHILRGLAECFVDLDPAYKSHSKVKIGVAGLPKRIIIEGVMGEYSYSSYGTVKLKDVIKALNAFRGEPMLGHREFEDMRTEARTQDEADWPGGRLKGYLNGNAHVIFDKEAQRDINMALAEFYGDILPDMEPDHDEGDLFKRASTEVSKDLAYYPTPDKVLRDALSELSTASEDSVLEPSCGDGRVMDYLRAEHPRMTLAGVEVHAGRATQARAKGHSVLTANFLECPPDPRFDLVVMNPPFYGQHWQKHLTHARKFLKPRNPDDQWDRSYGTLICILPATAFYDGHLGDMGLVRADAHTTERGWRDSGWHDLPVGSFAESGTNVPTGYFRCWPEDAV